MLHFGERDTALSRLQISRILNNPLSTKARFMQSFDVEDIAGRLHEKYSEQLFDSPVVKGTSFNIPRFSTEGINHLTGQQASALTTYLRERLL